MKLKRILVSTAVAALAVTTVSAAIPASAATTYKAQMIIQTDAWTYRNKMQDTTFGGAGDGDWEGKLIAWDSNKVAYDWAENSPYTFTDTEITGDGDYSIKFEGDLTSNCGSFNILGISTNVPRESTNDDKIGLDGQEIQFSNVEVYIDGTKATIPGDGVAILDPDTDNEQNVLVANMWNSALGSLEVVPTQSIEIKFTISGMGGGDTTSSTTNSDVDSEDDTTSSTASDDTDTDTTSSNTTSSTDNTTSSQTGATTGLALVGVALAGAAIAVSRKRK